MLKDSIVKIFSCFQKTYIQNRVWIETVLALFAIFWMLPIRLSNIISVVIVPLTWSFFKKDYICESETCRDKGLAFGFSFLFALFQLLGNLDYKQNFVVGNWDLAFYRVLVFVGWWFIFCHLIEMMFCYLDGHSDRFCKESWNRYSAPKTYFCVLLSCMAVYGFYILVYYPTVASTTDAYSQFRQFLGLQQLSNHHPLVHTLFLATNYNVGYYLFGTKEAGMAMCAFCQMFIMANIYAFTCAMLCEFGVRKKFIVVLGCYYAFFPLNAMYAIWQTKDVIFAGLALWFSVIIWNLEQKCCVKWIDLASFTVCGILFSMFRSNGYYAFLFLWPFLLFSLRKCFRKILLCGVLIVAFVSLFNGPVIKHFHIKGPDIVEVLSVPEQQIARVIVDGGHLEDDERVLLENIVDIERVKNTYNNSISDPIKGLIRSKHNLDYIGQHKVDYGLLWLKLGIRYPQQYLMAWIDLTKRYWCIGTPIWATDLSLMRWGKVNGIMSHYSNYEKIGIYEKPFFGDGVKKWFSKLTTKDGSIPIAALFRNPAIYFWGILSMLLLRIRARKSILCFLPVISIWISLLLASPVVHFRYAYAFVISLPFYVAITLSGLRMRGVNNDAENSSTDSVL